MTEHPLATLREHEIDEAFVTIDRRSRYREFKRLFRDLADHDILTPWRPTLHECRYAYYRDKHLIAVPALLAVLEGAVMAVVGNPKGRRVATVIRKNCEGTTGFRRTIRQSIAAFWTVVFGARPFEHDRPSMINRHWILHGRDVPDWGEADVLRLFQALHTVSLIADSTL